MIEIMVTVAIVVILAGLGGPSIGDWIKNAQIQNAAESIVNGLQTARLEALRRNTSLGFYLTNNLTASCALSSSGTNWVVSRDNPSGVCNVDLISSNSLLDTAPTPAIVKKSSSNSTNTKTTTQPNFNAVQFNALGRANVTGATLPIQIDISHPSGGKCLAEGGTLRCMRVTLQSSGQVRSCIPSLPASDIRAC